MRERVGRFPRLLALLAVGVVIAVAAPAAASAAVLEMGGTSMATADVASGCDDPCPTLVVLKGRGSGRVTFTQHGVSSECRPTSDAPCGFTADDAAEATLGATADSGSLRGNPPWDGCPGPILDDGDCLIPAGRTQGMVVCVIFVLASSPTQPAAGCLPTGPPPPPPPPPPAAPPPLGAPCTIPGSPASDVIRGTRERDVICGKGGNDVIYGGGGHDLLLGGRGADKLYGQSGRDRLAGGAGADRLDGGASDDELLGGDGADVFYARDRVRDRLHGGRGRDRARVDHADRVRAVERRF